MKRLISSLRRSTIGHGRLAGALLGLLVFAVLGSFASAVGVEAQAGLASIIINKSFVDQAGQPANPPSGSTANVQFTFSPSVQGQSPTSLFTFSTGQVGKGEAAGSLQTGTYTFQEVVPAGTTFASASVTQSGGATTSLVNGGQLNVAPGGTYTLAVTDVVGGQSGSGASASGTATLTIFKSLTGTNGQPTSGTLSGYSFTLTGQNGLPTQTQITNGAGQATFANLPAGVYALSETPAAGATFISMTINGVMAQQGQLFQIQSGGTYDVNVTNSVTGAGNVTIQTQAVDQNGQIVSTAPLSGYSFTITPQGASAGAATSVTTAANGQAITGLAPGSYAISATPPSGASLVGYIINNVPTQTGIFTVGVGLTTTIVASFRVAATPGTGTTGGTRTLNLQSGCNNVANTYANGSPSQTIASGVVPATSINSIWRFDNAAQAFRAAYFAPVAGSTVQPPTDIQTLNQLDPIFICVTTPATFTEPGI